MRKIQNEQVLGEVNISQIKIDAKSRDDIPQILRGIQYLYTNEETCNKLFIALGAAIPTTVNKDNGRPGMTLWSCYAEYKLNLVRRK